MILDTKYKQPNETLDYDIEFADWLPSGDTVSSFTVSATTGITITSSSLSGSIVKVWLSGGTTGTRYKITVRATTATGRIKEAEFYVKVKEL